MELSRSFNYSGIIVCTLVLLSCAINQLRCGPEKSVLFVTNNATKSRVNYKKKFDSLGVEAHVVRLALRLGARSTRN